MPFESKYKSKAFRLGQKLGSGCPEEIPSIWTAPEGRRNVSAVGPTKAVSGRLSWHGLLNFGAAYLAPALEKIILIYTSSISI